MQCKKKKERINVYSPTLFNFINYFWEINQGFMVILTCLCEGTFLIEERPELFFCFLQNHHFADVKLQSLICCFVSLVNRYLYF